MGRWYESRDRHVRLLSVSSGGGVGGESEEEEGEEGREGELNLLLLDPTQWKVQHLLLVPPPYLSLKAIHLRINVSLTLGSRSLCTARTH